MKELSIVKVNYIDGHKLQLEFNDGKVQFVDFGLFLNSSGHPEIQKYLDLEKFKQYKLIDGDLDWFDFDLTFTIWDLYRGKLLKSDTDFDQEAS